jgi:hypothetical protein
MDRYGDLCMEEWIEIQISGKKRNCYVVLLEKMLVVLQNSNKNAEMYRLEAKVLLTKSQAVVINLPEADKGNSKRYMIQISPLNAESLTLRFGSLEQKSKWFESISSLLQNSNHATPALPADLQRDISLKSANQSKKMKYRLMFQRIKRSFGGLLIRLSLLLNAQPSRHLICYQPAQRVQAKEEKLPQVKGLSDIPEKRNEGVNPEVGNVRVNPEVPEKRNIKVNPEVPEKRNIKVNPEVPEKRNIKVNPEVPEKPNIKVKPEVPSLMKLPEKTAAVLNNLPPLLPKPKKSQTEGPNAAYFATEAKSIIERRKQKENIENCPKCANCVILEKKLQIAQMEILRLQERKE